MYTFYSTIIKCNYLYFVVYIIASVYLRDRCRVYMCRTCSEPMRHPFRNDASHMNLPVRERYISHELVRYVVPELSSMRMVTVACYLVSAFVCVSFMISVA
jgi:hypothetical protein